MWPPQAVRAERLGPETTGRVPSKRRRPIETACLMPLCAQNDRARLADDIVQKPARRLPSLYSSPVA